jgi:hypothetical protein
MSQAIQSSKEAQREIASPPGPITKMPPKVVMEVFKYAVLSSEEARSHGVKSLCLVGKDWNKFANATSELWSKVTLAYPLHPDQLSASQKWLKASGQKAIDIEIDLLDPAWNKYRKVDSHPLQDPAKLQDAITVLRGSEHRWRSISIKSDIWKSFNEFLRPWVIPSLPLLESIFFEISGRERIRSNPLPVITKPQTLFGGNGTLMPKLRDVCLCVISVDWTSAAVSFQNLRKLEIRNQRYGVGPNFGEFVALIAASPRLETLDVSGYCPNPYTLPAKTQTSLVRLPELKHLVFGWSNIDFACDFLMTFRIPKSLETLFLINTGSGTYQDRDSTAILNLLATLGSGDPRDRDPSGPPCISVAGLKSLSVSQVGSDPSAVIAFLEKAPMVEEIHLTDVSKGVLNGIGALANDRRLPSLKRIRIRWIRNDGYKSDEAHRVTNLLREHGFQVTVEKFLGQRGGSDPVVLERLLDKKDPEWRT